MNHIAAALLVTIGLLPCAAVADDKPASSAAMSDKERIDSLIRQNQMLVEEQTKLKSQCEIPRTKEQNFAMCMQAAKGETSAMAAESIGEHCDQLLKK